MASVREFFPSRLLLWVLIPNLWKAMRRIPLTSDQNLRDFCERRVENIFGSLQLLAFAKVTLLVVQKKKKKKSSARDPDLADTCFCEQPSPV